MHLDNDYISDERQVQLSLIIPIYNGHSYISSLVQEITAQNMTDLEVIFVDDGSTDGSAEVIERAIVSNFKGPLQSQDADIPLSVNRGGRVTYRLIRQSNRGQGGARNTGLEAARGAWVMFCDQDDHMREDYLWMMLESAEAADCDILISGYDAVREDGSVSLHVPLEDTSWARFMNVTPWGKAYRTAFLREHGIRFYESPYGEDVYMMLLCEAAHARVCITSYVGYRWVQNMTSVSHTTHRRLNREASALSLFHKAAMEISGLDLHDVELRYFFLKTAIYHVLCVAGTTERNELLAYNEDLFTELETSCPGILQNPLVKPWRPKGERYVVRIAVWAYAMLHRFRLDGVALSIYGRLQRVS